MANISHNDSFFDISSIVDSIQNRLKSDYNDADLKIRLAIVDELCTFDLGRFLLINQGLNGYWTDYVINNNLFYKKSEQYCYLENFILKKSPLSIATQERNVIFKKVINQQLRENIKICSLPCGVMRDILSSSFTALSGIEITGIDIDNASLVLAKEIAGSIPNDVKVHFEKEDAWNVNHKISYDLLVSNGLNIYESNKEKLIKLYNKFSDMLKPNGYLLTSIITPSPLEVGANCTWNFAKINKEDFSYQKILFQDVIQAKWYATRTIAETTELLLQVGLCVEQVIPDNMNIFPSILARKL